MKKTKKWLGIVGNVLLWLFVVFAVVITILVFAANSNKDGIPSIGGKSPVSVLTDSMSPTFKAGDLIICDVLTDTEKSRLEVGDVITYYVDLNGDKINEINSHRIVDKYDDGGYVYYVTQGDNKETNPTPDSDPVVYYNVICKYTGTKIAGLGGFVSFLRTSLGFLLVIILPLVAFFIYELYRFIAALLDVRGKKNGKLTAAEEEAIKRKAIEEYLKSQAAPVTDDTKSPPPDDGGKGGPDDDQNK